jgi:hypothetical protein
MCFKGFICFIFRLISALVNLFRLVSPLRRSRQVGEGSTERITGQESDLEHLELGQKISQGRVSTDAPP